MIRVRMLRFSGSESVSISEESDLLKNMLILRFSRVNQKGNLRISMINCNWKDTLPYNTSMVCSDSQFLSDITPFPEINCESVNECVRNI